MSRIRLFHWRFQEAEPLLKQLKSLGHEVEYPNDKGLETPLRALRESRPDVIVIDLTRLPARGRNQAVAIRGQASIRNIPLVFVDGDREKVEKIRQELPDAIYVSRDKLASALKRAKPLARPLTPVYSRRTPAEKLGIKSGSRIAVLDAPADYEKVIGPIPIGASLEEEPESVLPFTLWFARDVETYLAGLSRLRRLAVAQSRVCVIYPKRQAGDGESTNRLDLHFARNAALRMGLVHYKTCSMDAKWTAMLMAVRSGVGSKSQI